MLEEILPNTVKVVESYGDLSGPPYFPEEEVLVSGAVDKRRAEFTTVRRCARGALAQLGVAPAPILPGQRGAPGWPEGIVGSMTHCLGYRAAAVAPGEDWLSIGIDAEVHDKLPAGVLDAIALADERLELRRLAAVDPSVHWDRLLFSAKESVYKAWFPLTRRWLDFSEARLTFDHAGTFTARLLVVGPVVGGRRITAFSGEWLVRDDFIVTAIVAPHVGARVPRQLAQAG